MEQEIRRPEYKPRNHNRASSDFSCLLAAAGLTAMMASLFGATAAVTGWALAKLFGLPDSGMYVLIALFEVPVLWFSIWTAGRAWHLERRLAAGKDMDAPVFKMMHYFRPSATRVS